MSVCLSVCLSAYLQVMSHLSLSLTHTMYIYIEAEIRRSPFRLCVCERGCVSVYLSVRFVVLNLCLLRIHRRNPKKFSLFVCVGVYLSVYLSVYVAVLLRLFLSLTPTMSTYIGQMQRSSFRFACSFWDKGHRIENRTIRHIRGAGPR